MRSPPRSSATLTASTHTPPVLMNRIERLLDVGNESARAFMGTTARRFLGFDDPENKNARRLRERYERYGQPIPAWLASARESNDDQLPTGRQADTVG